MADAAITESQVVPMTSEDNQNIPDAAQTCDVAILDTQTSNGPASDVQTAEVTATNIETSGVQNVDTLTADNVQTADVPTIETSCVQNVDTLTADVPTIETSGVQNVDTLTADVPTTETSGVQNLDTDAEDVQTAAVSTTNVQTLNTESLEVSTSEAPTTNVQTPVDTSDVQTTDISISDQELNVHIRKLQEELRVRTEERENFKNRLQQAESKLSRHTKKGGKPGATSNAANEQVKIEMERDENQQLREVIANMKIVIKDKSNSYACQELQMKALETQVAALKEVASLTKGMLSIRNKENEKLKEQIDLTQKKIESERVRNNAVLKKTELASSLNAQLREEYLNQVKLFGDLKGKYEKKINVLTEEVARLNREKEEAREETVDQ